MSWGTGGSAPARQWLRRHSHTGAGHHASPWPAAPPEAPAEGTRVEAQPQGWGPGRAAGRAGRAWQRLLAGLSVGPGAGGARPAPGIAPAAARPVAGRAGGGGGNPILPAGTWALLPAPGQASAANFSPGEAPPEHELSPPRLHVPWGREPPAALAGGSCGSHGTARPWASPQASPPSRWPSPCRAAGQAPELPSRCPHACGLGSGSPTRGHKPSRRPQC